MLDNTTADASTGNIVRILREGRDLWVFKEDGTEVFYNSGNADFPFTRINGAESDIGTISADSISQTHDSLFWISATGDGKGMVWTNEGYKPRRISTFPVEVALAEMSTIDDVKTYCYQQEGHIFFVMIFPNHTHYNPTVLF